jgi:protein TonB
MYEALRPRARTSSQTAGASLTVLIVAVVGYAAMIGVGLPAIPPLAPATTIVALPPPPAEDTPAPAFKDIDAPLPAPPIPLQPLPPIGEWDDSPFIVQPAPAPAPGPAATPAPPRPAPALSTTPRLRAGDPPPYPAAEIRRSAQGVTGLTICIDARGRVTSATLANSSGHKGLDDAALKWVRSARFTPATRDGAPQAVCDHAIAYEWRLENAR